MRLPDIPVPAALMHKLERLAERICGPDAPSAGKRLGVILVTFDQTDIATANPDEIAVRICDLRIIGNQQPPELAMAVLQQIIADLPPVNAQVLNLNEPKFIAASTASGLRAAIGRIGARCGCSQGNA